MFLSSEAVHFHRLWHVLKDKVPKRSPRPHWRCFYRLSVCVSRTSAVVPPGPVQPVASLETGASWTVSDSRVNAAVAGEFPLVAFPVQNNWLWRAAKNDALFLKRDVIVEQSDGVPGVFESLWVVSAEPSGCNKCESWEWKWDDWFWHRLISSESF